METFYVDKALSYYNSLRIYALDSYLNSKGAIETKTSFLIPVISIDEVYIEREYVSLSKIANEVRKNLLIARSQSERMNYLHYLVKSYYNFFTPFKDYYNIEIEVKELYRKLNYNSGCVFKCMIGVKVRKKAAGAFSFVNCEVRQSGELSSLPVGKGSGQWQKAQRGAELFVQGLRQAVSKSVFVLGRKQAGEG